LPSRRVVLVGASAAVEAWASIAKERGLDPVVIDESEREVAFRTGCRSVLAHMGVRPS
jgi:hypothetical protein